MNHTGTACGTPLNHPWTKWPPHAGPSVLFLNYRPLLGPPLDHLWTSSWVPFGPVFNHFKSTFQPPLDHFWTTGGSLLNHFCITLGPLFHHFLDHFWITFGTRMEVASWSGTRTGIKSIRGIDTSENGAGCGALYHSLTT